MRVPIRARLLLLPVVLSLAACANAWTDVPAADPQPRLAVAPEFTAFYEQFGGRRVLGEPITEPFTLEEGDPLLQYFQAVRLEYDRDPATSEAQRIRIFPLGQWALDGLRQQRLAPDVDAGPSRFFPETEQTVRGDFLAFYDANGGQWLLGPPISPELDRDGRRVQYFLNGRLDWFPELPPPQRVQMAHLGQAHFDAVMAFAYLQALREQFVPAASVTAVDVFAYVQYPTLYSDEEQLLHLTVLTPEGRSVSGLRVNAVISTADPTAGGRIAQIIGATLTGDQHQLHLPIDSTGIAPGQQVEISVSVFSSGGHVLGSDQVTYKTWW